jgi:hypothetical protein
LVGIAWTARQTPRLGDPPHEPDIQNGHLFGADEEVRSKKDLTGLALEMSGNDLPGMSITSPWAAAYAAAHSFASSAAKLLYVLGWCPIKAAQRAVWSSVLLNPRST